MNDMRVTCPLLHSQLYFLRDLWAPTVCICETAQPTWLQQVNQAVNIVSQVHELHTWTKDLKAVVRRSLTRYLTMLGWSSCLSRASSSSRSATWAATLPATVGSLLISTCNALPVVLVTKTGSCPGVLLLGSHCTTKALLWRYVS